MNVFEMFGFFMLGSVFNMLIMLFFLLILIGKIRKSLDLNIEKITIAITELLGRVEKITSIFDKGEK